jgi:hypothetical protein
MNLQNERLKSCVILCEQSAPTKRVAVSFSFNERILQPRPDGLVQNDGVTAKIASPAIQHVATSTRKAPRLIKHGET